MTAIEDHEGDTDAEGDREDDEEDDQDNDEDEENDEEEKDEEGDENQAGVTWTIFQHRVAAIDVKLSAIGWNSAS